METKLQNNYSSWWPKAIIGTFVFFALFIGNMVRQAMKSDVDLVSKDYYKQEIAYQQHINQVTATQKISDQIFINQADAAEQLSLVFPSQYAGQKVTGQVHFFRPSDAKLDFEMPLNLNSDQQQHIHTNVMVKGLWRVQLNWNVAGTEYFIQKDITLR
ncbi:FixH family protein [Adhaeribacter aquaticus]|uniref:FixH family protein n=1 Tax=Adhaeribacter aquaticus TaxID=299567 RepID=UPI0005529768|nr:FixH family protein [Adhaeribacter aquaticus]